MSPVGRAELAPGYTISRLAKGGWQLAGGHGGVDTDAAIADMDAFVRAGITTFDCADIYTGVEAMIGRFLSGLRDRRGPDAAARVQVHTKCVPDRERLQSLTRHDIESTVDRSRQRLGLEALDLVQLHWWDYDIPGAVDAACWLNDLRRAGKVRHVGLTNFDVTHVRDIVEAGVPIVSHQVQYSVLDRRPVGDMAAWCEARGIGLLAYGALAGGFLSERWLGQPAPREPLENRSLIKYRLIIEECGGWDYFQALLATMKAIAEGHHVTIGTIAIRWVLEQPSVAAVIVGARHSRHLAETVAAFAFALRPDDLRRLAAMQAQATGPAGDVYGLERVRGGRHAAIMRDNLQRT